MDDIKKRQFKRRFICLEEKIQILNRLKGGERPSSIGKSLNLNESTIRTIVKNEKKIRSSVAEGRWYGAKRVARTRDIDMIRMEDALMVWFEDCMEKRIPLSGNAIRQKALTIYQHLKEIRHSSGEKQNQTFSASKGWFENFKKRFSLHSIKLKGEAAPEDVEAAYKFTQELHEDELIECIDMSSSTAAKEDNLENMNYQPVPYFSLTDVQRGVDLAKLLELYFIENDPSVERSAKFKADLQKCIAPYQELLAEMKKTSTSVPTTKTVRIKKEDRKR